MRAAPSTSPRASAPQPNSRITPASSKAGQPALQPTAHSQSRAPRGNRARPGRTGKRVPGMAISCTARAAHQSPSLRLRWGTESWGRSCGRSNAEPSKQRTFGPFSPQTHARGRVVVGLRSSPAARQLQSQPPPAEHHVAPRSARARGVRHRSGRPPGWGSHRRGRLGG